MGEAKRRQLAVQNDALEALKVDPPGDRIHMQCDHQARATPDAQLTFFAEYWGSPGPAEQGWSEAEDTLKLSGWDKARRLIVLRRAVKSGLVLSRKAQPNSDELPGLSEWGEQIGLWMPDKDVQAWEYAVLVTNSACPLAAFGLLCRDRADCEKGVDSGVSHDVQLGRVPAQGLKGADGDQPTRHAEQDQGAPGGLQGLLR